MSKLTLDHGHIGSYFFVFVIVCVSDLNFSKTIQIYWKSYAIHWYLNSIQVLSNFSFL